MKNSLKTWKKKVNQEEDLDKIKDTFNKCQKKGNKDFGKIKNSLRNGRRMAMK